MKKTVYFIAILCLLICLLVWIYFISPNVRFMFQSIKYSWTERIPSSYIDDEYNVLTCNIQEYEQKIFDLEQQIQSLKAQQFSGTSQSDDIQTIDELTPIQQTTNTEHSQYIQKVLGSFENFSFSPQEYDDFFQIFWITSEFFGSYLRYATQSFEIYFFVEASYEELYNFFDVVAYDLPISLNQTNSFWRRSFFINLDAPDDFVRLVIEFEKKVFGLKIQKNYYNEIKPFLETF